jgi:glycosyltransferase involved in cell wall biosynthesis
LKISICIPQYNRIEYLVSNLKRIALQTYSDIEITISDDCSTDDTSRIIEELKTDFRFPIIYSRNNTNLGYDRNMRKSMELATGDYVIILGNDDSFFKHDDIEALVHFIIENNYPDIGFCNYVEDKNHDQVFKRASTSAVIGTGYPVALKYYRSFSFVAGIIWKRSFFEKINTDKFDGSVYSQIYLATKTILSNGVFFMMERPLVLKDIVMPGKVVNTYRDKLQRQWKNFTIRDGGLPRVMKVTVAAFEDCNFDSSKAAYHIMKGIYSVTYPYWIVDYKRNRAFVSAVGMLAGMYPPRCSTYNKLSFFQKIVIMFYYVCFSFVALIFPSFLFFKIKNYLYNKIKKG